jgi:hypothetical protein
VKYGAFRWLRLLEQSPGARRNHLAEHALAQRTPQADTHDPVAQQLAIEDRRRRARCD